MLESPYDRRRADDEEDAKNIAQVDNGDVAPFGVGLNLVKCAVGAGSFTFPFAFTQTGIVCGIIGIILFAVMAAYTMKLLADAEKKFLMIRDYRPIESPETGKPSRNRLTYPELMRTAYPTAEVFGYNYMSFEEFCVGSGKYARLMKAPQSLFCCFYTDWLATDLMIVRAGALVCDRGANELR
eukprot:jgi/Bigna1/79492/fgenesh1_pg.62_\